MKKHEEQESGYIIIRKRASSGQRGGVTNQIKSGELKKGLSLETG